jgi:hypothetical protein
MKFAIATVENFEKHGFDTTDFRKSVDGTKAIIHQGYVETLVEAVENNEDFTIYTAPSSELTSLLSGSEWSIQTEEI